MVAEVHRAAMFKTTSLSYNLRRCGIAGFQLELTVMVLF